MSETVRKSRKILVLTSVAGLVVLVVGYVLVLTGERGPRSQPAAAVAYAGLAVALCSYLVYLVTSRCPFCRKWVHPWYYPRPGVYCPRCGKTADK